VSQSFIHDHALLLNYLNDQFETDQIFIQDSKKFDIFKDNEMNCTNINQQVDLLKV